MIFIDYFETGNLSNWSVAQTGNGDLRVSTSAALDCVYGLEAVINDRTSMYLQDDRPTVQSHNRVRFKFDPNSIVMAETDEHMLFRSYTNATNNILVVVFGYRSGSYFVQLGVLNDSGKWHISNRLFIIDTMHGIEIDWRASTSAGANNGSVTLWIDGVQLFNLAGIDNDTHRIEMSRIGPLAGIDSGTLGSYYIDSYESLR